MCEEPSRRPCPGQLVPDEKRALPPISVFDRFERGELTQGNVSESSFLMLIPLPVVSVEAAASFFGHVGGIHSGCALSGSG